ncbi:ribosome biogenesis protein ytm1 [Balamuthia mandrillaris]
MMNEEEDFFEGIDEEEEEERQQAKRESKAKDSAEAANHEGEEKEKEMQVRFVTKLKDPLLRAPETPYFVPLRLSRLGLSEVVNFLLGLEPKRPFDFLIDRQFLRTSLGKYLAQHQKGEEEILTLEYVEASPPPKHEADHQHDDWISCLLTSFTGFVVTGSYDQGGCVWDSKGEKTAVIEGSRHTGAVKSATWLSKPSTDVLYFALGSKDHTISSWKVNTKNSKVEHAERFKGHTGSVEALAHNPSFQKFCSGAWDNTIKVWDPTSEFEAGDPFDKSEANESDKKKIKKEPFKAALVTLESHAQCVSCLTWPLADTIYSGSWDHSIRQWDVDSTVNTRTLSGEHVVLSVSFNANLGALISGHTDRYIRLWDPRSTEGAMVKQRFLSHAEWVSTVQWHPRNEHLFLSASHDGKVKVWDVRSITPLHTLPSAHKEKVLCAAWSTMTLEDEASEEEEGEKGRKQDIWSGGSDSVLKHHSFTLSGWEERG